MTDDVMVSAILAALRPLENIANAYNAFELDDEAYKEPGPEEKQFTNPMTPDQIELYKGHDGKVLLTLAHAVQARELCIAIVGATMREVSK